MASKYDSVSKAVMALQETEDEDGNKLTHKPIKLKIITTQIASLRRAIKAQIETEKAELAMFEMPFDHLQDFKIIAVAIPNEEEYSEVTISLVNPESNGFTFIE
tara:strand:- start:579 stop:890 length:312 start_codon:yes stop_codon:yes gene_type:complete